LFSWGKNKEHEKIDENPNESASSSEELTDDEDVARENARPQSTRTKIVVNLDEHTGFEDFNRKE